MNDPSENNRASGAASRKADSYLYVVFSAIVGFAAASILIGTVIAFCWRHAEPHTVPLSLIFGTLFVAVLAGFLFAGVSSHRIKRHRGFLRTQFTLGGMLAFITASGLLLGLLQWAEAAPWQWGAVVVFFGAVWTAQRLLSGGRHRWIASFVVGAVAGLLLWVWAWIAAANQAASSGAEVSTADLVRDLFLAVLLGGSLGVAANLLLAWSRWVVALPAVLLSGPTWHGRRQPAPCDSQPGMTEERPKATGDSAEVEPRRGESADPRRAAILPAAAAALLLAGVVMFQRPIRIWYYRHAAEYCVARFEQGKTPSPAEALLTSVSRFYPSYDSHEYFIAHHGLLDKLEALGYLESRRFPLQHVMTDTADRNRALLRQAIDQRFPDNIHTMIHSFHRSGTLVLVVWDRPSKIPEWEAFVQELDRPDFPENIAP
jgi:hypothetical protein